MNVFGQPLLCFVVIACLSAHAVAQSADERTGQVVFDAGNPRLEVGVDLTRNFQAEDFRLPCFTYVTGARFWTFNTLVGEPACQWRLYEKAPNAEPGVLRASGSTTLTATFTGNFHMPVGVPEYLNSFVIPEIGLEAGDYYLAIHVGNTCNVFRGVHWEPSPVLFGFGARSFLECGTTFTGTNVHHAFQILGKHLPPPCPGDADQNGEVNFSDITEVLSNFAVMCPG